MPDAYSGLRQLAAMMDDWFSEPDEPEVAAMYSKLNGVVAALEARDTKMRQDAEAILEADARAAGEDWEFSPEAISEHAQAILALLSGSPACESSPEETT